MFAAPLICAAAVGLAAAPAADPRRNIVVEVVEATKGSVVNIAADILVDTVPFRSGFYGDLFDEFFGRLMLPPGQQRSRSLGTGFVVRPGLILTNHHVVARAQSIRVTFAGGESFAADLVGAAPDVDLALLEITGPTRPNVPPLPFARNRPLIGETVIAIGNPFGLDHSVTLGVLSALDRTFQTEDRVYAGVLQTDASINPGNSGGPLIDVLGQVVGVNTAIFREAQGIGFAIPADVAQRVVDELSSSGRLTRGWLGLGLQDLDPRVAGGLGLTVSEGVVITDVIAGSPAARAGLRVGDVVRSIDDHRVRTLRDMAPHLASYPAGGTLRLGGLRDAAPMSWTLTVGTYDVGRVNGWFDRLGLVIEEREGVIIVTGVRAGSPAASIGFERGDVIFSIDRIPVRDRARLQEHLLRNRQKGYFLLGFQRQRFRQHIGLQLPPPDPSF